MALFLSIDHSTKQEGRLLFWGPDSVSAYKQYLSTFELSVVCGSVCLVVPACYKMAKKRWLEDEQITQELYLHSDSYKMLTSGDRDQIDSDNNC
jgi:hypothetical protein